MTTMVGKVRQAIWSWWSRPTECNSALRGVGTAGFKPVTARMAAVPLIQARSPVVPITARMPVVPITGRMPVVPITGKMPAVPLVT